MRLEQAHMGSTTCVVCTPWPQRHGAWCGLPSPRASMRAPKPCAVSQLMKPWAQCHGLMAPNNKLTCTMMPTHCTGVQCLVYQEGSVMGTMPWLVATKLDRTGEASNKPKPWAPRHGTGSYISVGKTHWCTRRLVKWLVHAAWLKRPWSKTC